MSRYYLTYRFRLNEPLILSNGSQIGNVLTTQDHIPGTTILGLFAGLYLRQHATNGLKPKNAHENPEFRELFLCDKTIFSPAYPVAGRTDKCIPMPFSIFGCKYYGFNIAKSEGRTMHGIFDCLYHDPAIPDICPVQSCDDPVEHKAGYGYFHDREGFCSHEVSRRIISHNRVAEVSDDKGLFSFEALTEGQEFYGEISFCDETKRDTLFNLLVENPAAKLGKARRRGYGGVEFFRPIRQDATLRRPLGNTSIAGDGTFSIYLYSDAVVLDRALNYRSCLDAQTLAPMLDVSPGELTVYPQELQEKHRSFWKNGILMGFNEKRRMPLPMEQTILRGSVFTVKYEGTKGIEDELKSLVENGIGVRRNEGFGQVIINLGIHNQHEKEEKDA